MEVRHKETEQTGTKGKSLRERVGRRCECKMKHKKENEREKYTGRLKVRQRDGEVLW